MKTIFKLAVAFAAGAVVNADAELSPSAEMCADAVIESLGGARWIIAEPGPLAATLRERLRESDSDVRVLTLMDESADELEAAVRAAENIPSADVRKALDLGAAPFLLTWLKEDPDTARSNVVLVANPALPEFAGFKAFPDGLVFRLAKDEPNDPVALRGLLARYMDKRETIGEALSSMPADAKTQSGVPAAFRPLAAIVGNNLGVMLAKNGMTNEAFNAFSSADAICPESASALLNTASLLKRQPNPALAARIGERLNDLAKRGGLGAMLALTGGWVMQPEDFYPAGWYNAYTGLHAADRPNGDDALATVTNETVKAAMSRAMQTCRVMQSARSVKMMKLLSDSSGTDWQPPFLLAAVDLCRRISEPARAKALALKLAELKDPDEAASALQAAVMLSLNGRAGDAADVLKAAERNVPKAEVAAARAMLDLCGLDVKTAVKNLSAANEDPDAPAWCGTVLSALRMQPGDERLDALKKAAHAVKNRMFWAVMTRLLAWECLTSGKLDRAKEAATDFSMRAGEDGVTDYILAVALRGEGNIVQAERHFQAALSVPAQWFVYNDYAALLTATGRAALAERFAREAVRLSGGSNPAALDTLGDTLMKLKRFKEAVGVLEKADALAKSSDPEIAAHLAAARKALEEAE